MVLKVVVQKSFWGERKKFTPRSQNQSEDSEVGTKRKFNSKRGSFGSRSRNDSEIDYSKPRSKGLNDRFGKKRSEGGSGNRF